MEILLVDEALKYDRVQLGDIARRYSTTNFLEREARLTEALRNFTLGR